MSFYSHMKAKYKKEFDERSHFENLLNTQISMFDWQGLPDTLRPEFIEGMLLTQGTCGVAEIKGDLYTGFGGYCGDIVNFLPTEYLITVVGVGDKQAKIGDPNGFAVGWNNALRTPDWALMQTANILTEVDVSERVNVLFSRFLRIPKVRDGKEKKAVEDSIAAILEGRISAVVSDNIRDILTDQDKSDQFMDLVDVKEVDKLQYLNQYRDNVVKRFFQLYGQGMQSTAKLAQQTTDELHGNDSISMILPLQKKKYRQKFADDINKLFGTNITVDFSEAYQDSLAEMYANNEKKEGETNDNENNDGDGSSGGQSADE